MRKLLPALILMVSMQSFAQDSSMTSPRQDSLVVPKIVKDHYTVSGGLLGAVNFSKFNTSGTNPGNVKYSFKPGWSAGVWLSFPLGNAVSFEPQGMYSEYNYSPNVNTGAQFQGRIRYFSVPALFKFHVAPAFAITLGPQFDFLNDSKDVYGNRFKTDFTSNSISGSAGFEVAPRSTLSIFARYIYGFTNMNASKTVNTGIKYRNGDIQAGLKLKLFGRHIPADSDGDGLDDKADKCPTVVGLQRYQGCPIPDTDADGINDEMDKCPNQAGTAKYNGCPIPDTDKDGINDEQDKCPTQAGTAKYNGCPIPDTDGDGINDEQDKCPSQAGTAKYNGCPIPDTDGDGVNDEMDLCPDKAGPASSKGCPVDQVVVQITADFKNILFDNGKATIRPESDSVLARAAAVINSQIPNSNLYIDGYTDNVGNAAFNKRLSKARAQAVANALIKNGVAASRVVARGFGKDNPICDNKTAEGRQCNRRVEVIIRNVDQKESQKSIKVNN